jgi:predicted amidohydrolase
VVEKIKAMTKRFPNILLFPGTIAWKKRMKESGVFGKDRSKAAYRRLDYMTGKHTTGAGNYNQHRERLDQADKKETFFAQNTAYVMKNGRIVLKYHKMADGGEVFKGDRADGMVVWVPGERKGTFNLDGLDVGLEICAERGAGILGKLGVGNLDVHVLISASHPANPSSALTKDGGYLLHADAHLPPAAYRKSGGASTPVPARHSFPSLGGTVSYYGLSLSR